MRVVAVATSGGRDSTALLHCTLRAARPLGLHVVALHVHHGLHAMADDWLAHVRAQARRWGAGFDSRRIADAPQSGESVEAWARRVRYAALTDMAQSAGCGLVLLAHHRRDQAETWLLQALRGGGARGLSAMPRQIERSGVTWSRPWLDQPRSAIEQHVQRHRLGYVDDPSNSDPRHARNLLRSAVWPTLLAAFPQAEGALTAAATHAQAAAALAAEVLAQDLPPLLDESGALHTSRWLALPPARRSNALQGWLRQALGRGAPEALLTRLIDELPAARSATWQAPGQSLRLYRGVLRAAVQSEQRREPVASLGVAEAWLDLSSPGVYHLAGWSGSLQVDLAVADGLPAALLQHARVAPRSGGERFALTPGGNGRSLKKQFQACGMPAWLRSGPLLYSSDGRLMWAPGLGVDAQLRAAEGEPQLRIAWVPDPPLATGPRQRAG